MAKQPHNRYAIFNEAKEIAEYYGFSSLGETLSLAAVKSGKRNTKFSSKEPLDRMSIMRHYSDLEMANLPHPIMVHHAEPLPKYSDPALFGGKDAVQFSLEIIGVPKSIAEAMLFRVTIAILHELGFKDLSIEINSVGDRESIARFTREFSNYCAKHLVKLPALCRGHLKKKDVFRTLQCMNEHDRCEEITEQSPKPISSLSEGSRTHFSEVLEFLESMDIPYSINNCLVGGKEFYTKTIFEIKTASPGTNNFKKELQPLLAKGGRYDDLSKHLGGRKEVPSVGITLSLGGAGIFAPRGGEDKRIKKAKAYLMQLGFEAKLKSLAAIEILRKARIPIIQSLSKDRISAQIATAENLKIPYTIIIGQKEALEGTAIVRNMLNRSQETIPVAELPLYLKGMA